MVANGPQGVYGMSGGAGKATTGMSPSGSLAGNTNAIPPASASAAAGCQQRAPGILHVRVIITPSGTFEVLRSLNPGPDPGAVATGVAAGLNVVRARDDGRLCVEKILLGDTPERKARARAEFAALNQIRKAGMPSFLNAFVDVELIPSFAHVILEYCDGGDLLGLIKRTQAEMGVIAEPVAWHVLAGISKALLFCHTGVNADKPGPPSQDWNTICHLDLKPANVFLSHQGGKNGFPHVVLGDFGCATTWKDIQSGAAARTIQLRGTPGWFPPECTTSSRGGWDGRYGIPTDVWQMGGVVQALCQLMKVPEMGPVGEGRACGRKYSMELSAVVGACMMADPMQRPEAGDVALEAKRQLELNGLEF
ncbi:hypothetical protein LTR53_011666 [Teratosphaeriaceae sp. CCFEE 6253]|nr:hypothetical protein LTR53_011666 [Teratosphaeriaceae sp. CCFEE 6253]